MRVFKGLIYKAKSGQHFSNQHKAYKCYMPVFTGDFDMVDCWVCNEIGTICPGYEFGVPIHTSRLSSIINKLDDLIL
jgi:hypothetical protein